MKEEDADWLVYHLIPPASPASVEMLVDTSGLDRSSVEASLARLERFCLVERDGEQARVLTFGESLIRNQAKYDESLPFTIENGVVRQRKT
ncbi:MAG: MarR family transcriptional regulator [Methanoregula sp.]|uniref:MarR family transcriptional regulator n=1 Tax=Methanoregula sp. TaxID=2052170 RepID=UPI003D0BEE4D